MANPPQYDAQKAENKWYAYWMEHRFFHSEVDERKPYSVVIPPPNVTGVLHMGHMLNNTLQDVLVRRARLKGFNACWVPGTDHASIATEAKVVAKLKAEGVEKGSLSREEFLKHAWQWTEDYGGMILEQLKKLGASCDWERTKFTMDDEMSEAVSQCFVDLYHKGMIYRGHRMVNWDPQAKTTLSDEEVIYKEQQGKLYYVKYPIENSDEFLIVATTRPETIFGDTAICINPNDERFAHLKGKKAIVPVVNRTVPIIWDEYVDREFGTGCLKVTPAHDPNDKALGERHDLQILDIFNDDASLNSNGLQYEGEDRFTVRKEFVNELKEKGFLLKTEPYLNNVGTSERTKAVIEPRLSVQWFLRMKKLADPAIKAVAEEEIRLFPKKFNNTYFHWMENIRDWNISRQLWWGHQIPAFYYGDGEEDFVVAETKEKALEEARLKSDKPNLQLSDIKQDPDVVDTWFSSWLWPMSVFDGIRNPQNKEFQYYYPTQDLVTAPDILFFWVARMIMAGYEYTGKKPFKNVYLTGLVRDEKRRKMSKSLGNSPDALKLIENYSADGVRVGLLLSSAAGNDLLFDESLCKQGKGFGNKIWNAFLLVKSWKTSRDIPQPEHAKTALEWYRAKFKKTLIELEGQYEKYRISDALMATYKLLWDDFCSWLLEAVKPDFGKPIDEKTHQEIIEFLEGNLKILHPFMPFLTEEIWHGISKREPREALVVSQWPRVEKPQKEENELLANFDFAAEVVSGIRALRKEKNISFKNSLELQVMNREKLASKFDAIICKMGNISEIKYIETKVEGALSFRVKSNEYFIPISEAVDVETEKTKLKEELAYTEGFLKSVEKKLSNERFVSGAPEKVVEKERKKKADAAAKIETIRLSLESLG